MLKNPHMSQPHSSNTFCSRVNWIFYNLVIVLNQEKNHGNFSAYDLAAYTYLEEKAFNFKINSRTLQKLSEEGIVYNTVTIFGTAMF